MSDELTVTTEPRNGGYAYVVHQRGERLLTSGVFMLERDALASGRAVAADAAVLHDFLKR